MSMYGMLSNVDSSDEDAQNLLHDESDVSSNRLFYSPVSSNKNLIKDETKNILGKEESTSEIDYLNFNFLGIKKLRINKSLLTFRIAQFLWYGAGSLPSLFFGVFMKQRGLTLVEISSIYSMVFLFQLSMCSVSGIITDKIGNAKPVLIFLMLSCFFSLVLILFTPHINSTTCISQKNISNKFNKSKYAEHFSFCYKECFLNSKNRILHEENYSQNSIFQNALTVDQSDFKINAVKNFCNFSNVPLKNTSLYFSEDYCCNACMNDTKLDCVTERNGHLVLVYAILILIFYSVFNTAFRFMNFAAVSLAEKHNSHIGKEFAFSKCGDILVVVIAVFILNAHQASKSEINYDPIIGITACIIFCAFLSLWMVTVPILPPGKNFLKNAFSMIKDFDMLAFILLIFVAGSAYSFASIYRLIYFESIRAPRILISLHSVAVFLYAFPTLLTSQWWLRKFGTKKLFILGLFFYAVNNALYSCIYNPWWFLVVDTTVAFTHDLFWVSVVVHCWDTAPEGFAATLNAVIGSVHYGMGRSSGVFFGGMMMNYIGPRKAFRIMAAICFITAVLYSFFIFKRHNSPPDDDKRKTTGLTDEVFLENDDMQDKIKKSSALMKVF